MAHTPQLNSSGIFKLTTPFDKLVTPDVIYTCRSLRSISDILAAGDLVYETYYKPLGVTEASYKKDLAENVPIAGLQAGTGEWIYVPASFIAQAPDVNGVKYTSLALGITLGALPDDYSLEGVKGLIANIITGTIGIVPQIKGIMIAQPTLLSREHHERLVAARATKVTITKTDYARAMELETENQALRKKVGELEQYIKSRYVP